MIRIARNGLDEFELSTMLQVKRSELSVLIEGVESGTIQVWYVDNEFPKDAKLIRKPQVLRIELSPDFPRDYIRASLHHLKRYLNQKKFRYVIAEVYYNNTFIGELKDNNWRYENESI